MKECLVDEQKEINNFWKAIKKKIDKGEVYNNYTLIVTTESEIYLFFNKLITYINEKITSYNKKNPFTKIVSVEQYKPEICSCMFDDVKNTWKYIKKTYSIEDVYINI